MLLTSACPRTNKIYQEINQALQSYIYEQNTLVNQFKIRRDIQYILKKYDLPEGWLVPIFDQIID